MLHAIEPWGDLRGDLQAATVATVTANAWRGKGRPARVKDFLPDFWRERRKTPEEMIAVGRAFAAGTRAAQRTGGG